MRIFQLADEVYYVNAITYSGWNRWQAHKRQFCSEGHRTWAVLGGSLCRT